MKRQSNNSNNRTAFFKLLAIFYIVLIAGLVFLCVLFYRNRQAFASSAALVNQVRTVIEHTDNLLLLSQNLQWELRNYRLSGDINTYKICLAIRDTLQKNAVYLIRVFNDNGYHHDNAIKLQRQIEELAQLADSSLIPRESSTGILTDLITNLKQHTLLRNQIARQVQVIKSDENNLLTIRRAEVYKTVDTAYRIFIASGILIFVLLTGTFVFVYYHFKKRQKAEQKLAESEHRFQVLVNSTKDLAIFMIDKNGLVINWYEGAHNIKGYTSQEVIGKPISIFYTPEAVERNDPWLNLQLAAEQGSIETEGWRVRKDGSRFWADVLITAIYGQDGKVAGFTKVTRDFTLHKQVDDEMRNMLQKEKELNEMKSRFVSMASHEFRTPLTTVLSSVSLLELYKTTELQHKRDGHIQRIKSSVSDMVAILEEFLSIEKIEEGKAYAKKEVFNFKELASEACNKFTGLLKSGQTIVFRHSGAEEVCLDIAFISHILSNLLSNAIKYSPENTEVIFETSVNESILVLKVKDHGIGISAEDQAHLFERFFRASNAGSVQGTGLGLHIVKRYIELMQGSIFVESEIGKGTVVIVTLPAHIQ